MNIEKQIIHYNLVEYLGRYVHCRPAYRSEIPCGAPRLSNMTVRLNHVTCPDCLKEMNRNGKT
jgi:hypothetical protein